MFSPIIKMERLKVKELKALSKSLGYSRLNKSDLVKLIVDDLNSRPRLFPQPCPPPPRPAPSPRPPMPMRPPPPPPPRPMPPRLMPPPRPIPPPRPPDFHQYQLRDRNPEHTSSELTRTFDPKKLKRMKKDLVELNRKIRHSRKRHDNVVQRRNNLKRAIDEMLESRLRVIETPPYRDLHSSI